MAYLDSQVATHVSGLSLTITRPTVADGQLMMMAYVCDGITSSGHLTSPPSGWTQIGADLNNAGGTFACWYKVASGEGTSHAWTWDADTGRICMVEASYNNTPLASPHRDGAFSTGGSPASPNVTSHAVAVASTVGYITAGPLGVNPLVFTIGDDASATHRNSVQSTNGFGMSYGDEDLTAGSEPSRSGAVTWTSGGSAPLVEARIVLVGPTVAATGDNWAWA